MGSNDVVPDEGFEGAVGEVESRVRQRNELRACGRSHLEKLARRMEFQQGASFSSL